YVDTDVDTMLPFSLHDALPIYVTRLLTLPEDIILYMSNGELSMGHGRALLGLKDKKQLYPLVKKILHEQLNVRQVEKLINELNDAKPKKKAKPKEKDVFIQRQELKLRDVLGTNVKIQQNKHKGKIEIEFYTNEDLERLISLLEQ